MSSDRKRIVEMRLIVIVLIDLSEPTLTEALAASGSQPSSLAGIVSCQSTLNLQEEL